jgi:hypothetical protein
MCEETWRMPCLNTRQRKKRVLWTRLMTSAIATQKSRCAVCPDKNDNLETPRQDCRWSSSQKSDGDSALKHWGTLWGLRIATALRVDGWIQIEDIRQHTV